MSEPKPADILAAVEGLQAALARIETRLEMLEARQQEVEAALEARVDPDTLVVLAAAVTSYLGVKVRIRSARRMTPTETTPAWASFGRAAMQASHHFPRHG